MSRYRVRRYGNGWVVEDTRNVLGSLRAPLWPTRKIARRVARARNKAWRVQQREMRE